MISKVINQETGELIIKCDFGANTPSIIDSIEIDNEKYTVEDKIFKIEKKNVYNTTKECILKVSKQSCESKTYITLKDFIERYIVPNSLIRLWTKHENGGHEMIYKEDPSKPNNIDDVCMEWQLIQNKVWQSFYKDCKVIGIKDICVDGFYREAINIVIVKEN